MKVICKPGNPGPYTKGKVYECEIVVSNGIRIYHVACPEKPQMWQGGLSGYSDNFPKVFFDEFFIDIREQRKLKLEKLNEKW